MIFIKGSNFWGIHHHFWGENSTSCQHDMRHIVCLVMTDKKASIYQHPHLPQHHYQISPATQDNFSLVCQQCQLVYRTVITLV